MVEIVLVFDVGTTGARTIVYDSQGKEITKSYEEYKIERQPPGISEHNPEIWWSAVKTTCNQVSRKINLEDLVGICFAFHRATTTIIDKDGKILHPALTWMDEREVTDLKAFQGEVGLRRSIPKVLWIKNNHPALFEKAAKIISPDSYFYMKLCDQCVTDPSNGIFYILNMDTLQWDPALAEALDLPLELWPELRTPGDVIGELTSSAAGELGLKKGLPIITGGGDQQCAALGLGVANLGQVKATTGTGTFVDLVVEHPVPPAGDIPIFSLPHVVKGKWVIEGAMPGTGTALQWFRDNFSQLQMKESGTRIYDTLNEEAAQVPPGSEGLLFMPLYIFKKGTIYGLGFGHSRAHFVRAIMESAALSAQVYLGLLEGMARQKTTELRVDGGGMNSDLWCQIFADIVNRKILVAENKDGAGLGAAILGLYKIKKYSSYDHAIQNMVRFIDTKDPIKEHTKVYKK
ncbi:MAG: FGGY-family carbohydrate kinase, partial [Candidatus Helarchaeota archaeon]